MIHEAEVVRDLLSRLTGAPFRVTNPEPADPFIRTKLIWFVACPDAFYLNRMAYAQRVWKDEVGITIETDFLGNTVDWIELEYGDDVAGKSRTMDYTDFWSKQVQDEFALEYPRVAERVKLYQRIAANVSKRKAVNIEVRATNSDGMVWLTLAANAGNPDSKNLESVIATNVNALKEAFEEARQA